MVIQYPHILTATIVPDSVRDTDGNWVLGEAFTLQIKCRAEPNVRASYKFNGADGSSIQFDWTVYMLKGQAPIPTGSSISITWNGAELAKGRVLRFSPGQLNSRLWL